jgi:hypothetical protein
MSGEWTKVRFGRKLFRHVIEQIAESLELFGISLLDLDAEFFLDDHDELDEVERIGVRGFDQISLPGDYH